MILKIGNRLFRSSLFRRGLILRKHFFLCFIIVSFRFMFIILRRIYLLAAHSGTGRYQLAYYNIFFESEERVRLSAGRFILKFTGEGLRKAFSPR